MARNAAGQQSTDLPSATSRTKAPSGFRADVEGLRALSVLLVVACHAGIPFLAGGFVGVDVFFVISGFLITGLLFREAAATGRVSIRNFYARRARRILPMAALVLLSVCIASWLLIPPIDRPGVGTDVTGAALFVSNWVFAAQANDYFAMTVASSPVLHFWSLSVEEQFYLIWPVLIFALAVIGKRRGLSTGRKRALIGIGLALPIAASLVWSVSGGSSEIIGYYGLQTRLWELGAGGLAAVLLVGGLRLPGWVRGLLAYSGIALIMFGAVTFDSSTPFPGVNALLPVCGALLVVCSGAPGVISARVLSIRPMQYVGARSYNLYLWHWPFLVFAGLIVARETASDDAGGVAGTQWAAAIALGLALLVTIITFRFVETPMRHLPSLTAQPQWTLVGAAALITLTVVAAQLLSGSSGESAAASSDDSAVPAGATLSAPPIAKVPTGYDAPVWPMRDARMSAQTARSDRYNPPPRCEPRHDEDLSSDCVFGDPHGTTRIALVGDSHANMWLPAFDSFGKAQGIQVHFWAHNGWPPLPLVRPFSDQARAAAWHTQLINMLVQNGPFDAIVLARTSGQWLVGAVGADGELLKGDAAAPAHMAAAQEFTSKVKDHTTRIVFLRDTNWSGLNVPSCIDAHDGHSAGCTFPRRRIDDALAAAELAGARSGFQGPVIEVDPAPLACPLAMEKCPAVAPDGSIVLRDTNHLTATVARNLSPALYRLLAPALGKAAPAAPRG